MRKLSLFLLFLALTSLSRAQLVLFETHLSGSQEVPSVLTSATGSGWATLDLSTNLFVFNDSWSGLTSGASASHIHAPAPVGVNAVVIFPFTLANGFVVGATSGSVSYSTTLTALQASQLLDGLFYVNVHSLSFTAGEIRGQLVQVPVPEPSTYAVGAVALLGFVAWRRSCTLRNAKKV